MRRFAYQFVRIFSMIILLFVAVLFAIGALVGFFYFIEYLTVGRYVDGFVVFLVSIPMSIAISVASFMGFLMIKNIENGDTKNENG